MKGFTPAIAIALLTSEYVSGIKIQTNSTAAAGKLMGDSLVFDLPSLDYG